MGKGTGTQHYMGVSISEGSMQHLTGGKTHLPALQPLSAAWLPTSALRKANFSCSKGTQALNALKGIKHPAGKTTQQGHGANPQL